MKIILGVLIYLFGMFSISIAIAIGVKTGLKLYFDENKTSKKGGK